MVLAPRSCIGARPATRHHHPRKARGRARPGGPGGLRRPQIGAVGAVNSRRTAGGLLASDHAVPLDRVNVATPFVTVFEGPPTHVRIPGPPDVGVNDAIARVTMSSYTTRSPSLLLVAVITQLVLVSRRAHPSLALLALAFGANLLADIWFIFLSVDGTRQVGQLVDVGCLIGYLALGAAALHPGDGPGRRAFRRNPRTPPAVPGGVRAAGREPTRWRQQAPVRFVVVQVLPLAVFVVPVPSP
jgi:hypothetical protein